MSPFNEKSTAAAELARVRHNPENMIFTQFLKGNIRAYPSGIRESGQSCWNRDALYRGFNFKLRHYRISRISLIFAAIKFLPLANLLRQWDSGSYFLNFSLHSLAMRLKIEKIRSRSPTWLATIA